MAIQPINPVEMGIEISDDWLENNKNDPNAFIDFMMKDGAGVPDGAIKGVSTGKLHHMIGVARPRSIFIDRHMSDDTATTAKVRGLLLHETPIDDNIKARTLPINTQIPRAYKRIYAMGTTARGIEIDA